MVEVNVAVTVRVSCERVSHGRAGLATTECQGYVKSVLRKSVSA